MKVDEKIENAYIDNFFFFFNFEDGEILDDNNDEGAVFAISSCDGRGMSIEGREGKTFEDDDDSRRAFSVLDAGKNLFLTGKAGTGKTSFLEEYRKRNENNSNGKNVVVLAPTGIAAENASGKTIHSFLNIPIETDYPGYPCKFPRKTQKKLDNKKDIIKQIDVVVIDEISMVRCDTLDAIDSILRYCRDCNEPFGGIQMVLIGDLYQLPPVAKIEEWDKIRIECNYENEFFFSAKVLKTVKYETVELRTVRRTTDVKLVDVLNRIRIGTVSKDDIDYLNKRHEPNFTPDVDSGVVILSARNTDVRKINNDYFYNSPKLKNVEYKEYKATICDVWKIKGKKREDWYPVKRYLRLKIGSRVMCTRNTGDYTNGTLGWVVALERDCVRIKKDDGDEVCVTRATWEQTEYKMDERTKHLESCVTGRFVQFPLKLAWAISIHKCQGLSFDTVVINAANSFAAGQVYVALSRCRTFNGIHLLSPITRELIMVDESVRRFFKTMSK